MGRTTFVRAMARMLVVGILATSGLVALTGTSWAADRTRAAEENAFATKINVERRREGLRRLTVNLQLTRVARGWSDQMAADDRLYHNPRLASQVDGDWTRLGENVGYSTRTGTSGIEFVNRLHLAFMNSPGHRANVLGDYNQVGIGVRVVGHTMWVTVNFSKSRTVVSNGTVSEASQQARRVFAPYGGDGRRARYVVLTASDRATHAMGGAALAGANAPLLYTHPGNRWDPSPVLHPVTRAQIDRVLGGAGLVYAVGGRNAVSDRAVRELVADGYSVRRLAGSSTEATLAAVARETVRRRGNSGKVVIANRTQWGPSVAGAVWSARSGAPFLVTGTNELHPAVRDFLRTYRPSRRWVLGSRKVIAESVRRAASARRVSGGTAPGVSVNVARKLWGRTQGADGDRWASTPAFSSRGWGYTLAYAPWAAANRGPALLVKASRVPAPVRSYLADLDYRRGVRGRVQAASPVPASVVNRVENLVAAP